MFLLCSSAAPRIWQWQRIGRFNLPAREARTATGSTRATRWTAPPPVRTTVTVERPKTIITRNQSPDIAFDRSINPYRGCEHGCIYCFARPTHAFHDLSPGLDFESRLFAKPDAPALLRAELSARSYVCRPIAFGTNTDPYQPIEATWRITRDMSRCWPKRGIRFTITTKSDRVLRDHRLIAPMAAKGCRGGDVSSPRSIRRSRARWSRARRPRKRLAAIRALTDAACNAIRLARAGVPQITDHEMEHILEGAPPRPARAAPSSCPCGCRTKWRRCSAPGWTRIIPIAPPR
jgi:DNA repair photolyase